MAFHLLSSMRRANDAEPRYESMRDVNLEEEPSEAFNAPSPQYPSKTEPYSAPASLAYTWTAKDQLVYIR